MFDAPLLCRLSESVRSANASYDLFLQRLRCGDDRVLMACDGCDDASDAPTEELVSRSRCTRNTMRGEVSSGRNRIISYDALTQSNRQVEVGGGV